MELQSELIECKCKVENLEKEIMRLNDLILKYHKKIELFGDQTIQPEDVLKKDDKDIWINKGSVQKLITTENELIKNVC